jgi:hypothetical protein
MRIYHPPGLVVDIDMDIGPQTIVGANEPSGSSAPEQLSEQPASASSDPYTEPRPVVRGREFFRDLNNFVLGHYFLLTVSRSIFEVQIDRQ